MDSLLGQAFVYLAAAVLGVPVAKQLGLGSVLGYLIAGVLIGPFALGLVGREGHDVMHFAEFGVVMMLFLVGLELRPAVLWQLRRPILGLGGLQVVVTAGVVGALAWSLGLEIRAAAALGLIAAMSSTAIVLQSLGERGLMKSTGGQASFSVLLFQDLAVIPILAVFPLLGEGDPSSAAGPTGPDGGVATSTGPWQALVVLAAVSGIVLSGRYVVRPLFRLLAKTRLREVFTAAALLLVVGIALLMDTVGLSPALGTFLAGVVLAENEYRHQLEGDIEPFKGLLLGLFFIAVGAQIDFRLVANDPVSIVLAVVGLVAVKTAVLYGLGRAFALDRAAAWLCALGLSQVGEFAFVLLSFARQHAVLEPALADSMVAVVALSMAITPLGFVLLERVLLPRLQPARSRPTDAIDAHDCPVVMAGFGRYGQVVGRMLRANGISATVLDLDGNMVDLLRRLGHRVYYGDASRPELLHAAGCARAKIFVLAIDDPKVAVQIAETVRREFPHLTIIARARNRPHYYELRALGIQHITRETLASAIESGTATLRQLGFRAYTAHRLAALWRTHDEAMLEELAELWKGDEGAYFAAARRAGDEAERLMRSESPAAYEALEDAWDNEDRRGGAKRSLIAPIAAEP